MFRCFVNLTVLIFPALAFAQTVVTDSLPQRTNKIRDLSTEIVLHSNADVSKLTKAYIEDRLSRIRQTVQEQMLETLRATEKTDAVEKALKAVLERAALPEYDEHATPTVFSRDVQGLKTIIIGYNIYYGSIGIPSVKVVIDGYRKVGGAYELAAEAGGALENCSLVLEPLNSPRSNEVWLLAHGHLLGRSEYKEMIRIYGFDGYEFRDLWAPSVPRHTLGYQIAGDRVTVTYFGEDHGDAFHKQQDLLQDIIQLTSGGPVVSTSLALQR